MEQCQSQLEPRFTTGIILGSAHDFFPFLHGSEAEFDLISRLHLDES
jgi:hypothetical protein